VSRFHPATAPAGLLALPRAPWGVLVLLLSLLAIGADYLAPVILVGHSLVLGLVFYWFALHLVGPNRALFVLAAGTLTLTFKWGQPYSGLLIALEGLAVGWAWRRRRNPFVADLAYWLLIGTPVSLALYRHVYVIPYPSLGYAMAVQPVNGFLAVWLAYLAMEELAPAGTLADPARPPGFRQLLLKRYIAFGTLPVLVVTLIAAWTFEKRTVSEASQRLQARARHLSALLSREIARGIGAVELVAARHAGSGRLGDDRGLVADLDATQAAHPLFLTLLAAGSDGRVLAASPDSARAALARSPSPPLDVGDRDYFRTPMQSGRPHVSGVFLGRGFGRDPLIALSAPVIDRTGARLGVIEGSVSLSYLQRLLTAYTAADEDHTVLTDRHRRVIANQGLESFPLASLNGTVLGRFIREGRPAPTRLTMDHAGYRTSFLTVSVPVEGTDWVLTLQQHWRRVMDPVVTVHAWALVVGLGTAAVAALFTTWSLRGLLRAWQDMIAFSRSPTTQSQLLDQAVSLRLPQEFRELLQNLSLMSRRLASDQQQREALLARLEQSVKERTHDLQVALVKAQTADRAKSAFLATVSHELRTPLTSLITGMRLLRASLPTTGDLTGRTLATMERAGDVLMNVISEVLDYSKLEAGGITIDAAPFHPAPLLTDVAAILDPAARRAGLALHSDIRHPAELAWTGDVHRLRQILLNLAGNAVKFTPAGHVTLSSWVESPADPEGAARLCFAVTDSGPGIPAEHLDSIFEPFVQLETNRIAPQAGTGLGLSICRKLVELMGGRIVARSTLGQGSTFEFWIPAAPPASPAATPAAN
jgi:signal transduction histidine kinase